MRKFILTSIHFILCSVDINGVGNGDRKVIE